MAKASPWRKLFPTKVYVSTTWIHRGEDRRKENLGRFINRRKNSDRRSPRQTCKAYEYVGLSQGGWTETN